MLSQLCDCISGDYILDFVRKNRKTLEHNNFIWTKQEARFSNVGGYRAYNYWAPSG